VPDLIKSTELWIVAVARHRHARLKRLERLEKGVRASTVEDGAHEPLDARSYSSSGLSQLV